MAKEKNEYRALTEEEIDKMINSIKEEIYGSGDYVPEKFKDSNGMSESDYARNSMGWDKISEDDIS